MAKGAIFLPTTTPASAQPRPKAAKWPLLLTFTILASLLLTSRPFSSTAILKTLGVHKSEPARREDLCKQAEPTVPKGYNTSAILEDREKIIDRLIGAVQIGTETFDDLGKYGEDTRWDGFPKLHRYLEEQFPLVHSKLLVTKPDPGLALIYEWKGSDDDLKPVLITAHQDTVPVLPASLDQWLHPPFSGHFDGEFIWGRGATDTKSSLIAILSTLEHLLQVGFKPERTIIVGFGNDEEVGGPYGAVLISKYIGEKYGKDSLAILIDEGNGLISSYGQNFATPAVTEKGSTNIQLTVKTLGGHSSVPPPHTAIGLLSLAIAEIEAHPHGLSLPTYSAIYGFLECAAGHAGDLPEGFRKSVLRAAGGDEKALKRLPEAFVEVGFDGVPAGPGQGNVLRALLGTTQATDIINGGVKVNALPEVVSAKINHRINIDSNSSAVTSRLLHLLAPLAQTYNLSLSLNSSSSSISPLKPVVKGGAGEIILDDGGRIGEAAPISPFDINNGVWDVFAGTARGVWASRKEVSEDGSVVELGAGDDLVVTPFLPLGNTDTRHYWDYTDNIYRFIYRPSAGALGAHTINERVNAKDLVELVRFYTTLLLNFDAAKDVSRK
ncbi:hypothetical protein L198_08054 [Cryptococcus wingfieldii CBS 7118]|uniref:Peptidase M20 dimerisation domain-containing protein n=1 Tax=Cryptococcus wingfieldii CBS 7118 TaxID=1295528 RepID=A0A1E3HJD3_9TREE|nr:hypothetical protein L198_08054 [Cryptococcus wingfieldii CBS 7118]ODN76459.1 hypothetical protein L198_08054 [Cryptococcus wingfieldii CBS 7118]